MSVDDVDVLSPSLFKMSSFSKDPSEGKLACFRKESVSVWCQIMSAEESEKRVIKDNPPIIMSNSAVVLQTSL